jgi:NADH dehydrogenase
MKIGNVLQRVGDAVDEILLLDRFHNFKFTAHNILTRRPRAVWFKFSHMSNPARVVVIGGGFAGLWAVRRLRRAPVSITLIDRRNHHLFQPLLYQVATAGLAAPSIAAPLRHILRGQRNTTVLMGEVLRIDTRARVIALSDREIPYDYLLVASGATHAYFGRDHWEQFAPGLKTLDDAFLIRRRVLSAFERAEAALSDAERDACLTFAVIGAGPTGTELAGTLAEIARHTLARDFRHIDSRKARVMLIEAGPRVLATFTEALSDKARAQLTKLGVEVFTGTPVTDIGDGFLKFGDRRVAARTILWAAGVAASPLGKQLGAEIDRAGRVRVLPDLSLPSHPEVFVAGDLASLEQAGKPVPGVAPAAKQMGACAASNILARISGRAAQRFHYTDFGALATIGRHSAIAQLPKLHFSGIFAWWFWLILHIYFLIGFRSRLIVLINWAWAYFTYARGARIILGNPGERDANGSEEKSSN